jgi:hypothetical protein
VPRAMAVSCGVGCLETGCDRRRVKELERGLHRKDKALAETVALFVLSKNWQRSATKARTHDLPGRRPNPGG